MTLPAGWQSAPLAAICRVVSGGTPKTDVPAYWGGDIPWVTPKDLSINRSQVVHGGARSLTTRGLAESSAALFPRGSVIVSSRAPIGYVAIAGREMATNQGCKIAVPPESLDSRYLYWYLLAAKEDLEARASGTTFKEISGKEFGRTVLRWPAREEQRRIADLVEGYSSRLDGAKSAIEQAQVRVETLRRSVLDSALTGRL
jgi:type I restriction enzyme, S subunit